MDRYTRAPLEIFCLQIFGNFGTPKEQEKPGMQDVGRKKIFLPAISTHSFSLAESTIYGHFSNYGAFLKFFLYKHLLSDQINI